MKTTAEIVLEKISNSEADTKKIAKKFANDIARGDVVILSGELGSGKTFFVRQIADALGYKNLVTSPTFVILNIYETQLPIFHFDLYRIKNEDELENIGFSDFLNRDGVVFVEWPEVAKRLLPKKYYGVNFDIMDNDKRKILIKKIEDKE